MKTLKLFTLVFVLSLISLACNFVSGLMSGGSGPANLKAELTAPDVVNLSWDPVEGATGYAIEMSIEDSEFFPIISFTADKTSYEDLTAPEKSNLRYQVQVVTESGLGGKSTVSIETEERVPNPLTVKPTYEENTASAVIGTAGGTLSVVDASGVDFTLEIPEGALSSDTEIRMTPVSEIQDWPLDGDGLGAVKLEPEGLVLNEIATLTIGIPVDLDPNLSVVGFAFQGSGEEFHLSFSSQGDTPTSRHPIGSSHLVSPKANTTWTVVVPFAKLHGLGAGQSSGSKASQLVRENSPSNTGDAFQQKQAAGEIADDELAPLTKVTEEGAVGQKQAKTIANRIFLSEDCDSLSAYITYYREWRTSGSYQGATIENQQYYDGLIRNELKSKVKKILEDAGRECEESAQEDRPAYTNSNCAKDLLTKITNPPSTSSGFWEDFSAVMKDEFTESELQQIKDKLDKCKKKAYHIYGPFDEEYVNSIVCDSSKPFRVNGSELSFEFTPTGENMGTYEYTGPYDAEGTGPYLIYSDGRMSMSGYGCITFPMLGTACDSYEHQWTADPLKNTDGCVDQPSVDQ